MTSGEKGHSGFGHRMKGAAHVVHGIGENIRGSVMGAVESASGSEEAKAKDEDLVSKGRSEIEQGIAQMKGVAVPSTAAAGGPEPQVPTGGQTGGQPKGQQQPAKEELPGSAQVPAPPEPTHGVVGTESRQAEPETSQQGQTEPGKAQQSSQETQAASETKPPQTGDKGLIGEGADAPQGPGSGA